MAVFDAVEQVVKGLPFDVDVVSWLRPGATINDDGVTPSNHAKGEALDLRPKGWTFAGSSPCGGSMLDGRSMEKLDILNSALSRFDEWADGPLWRTCTGGNHYDHVHVGLTGGALGEPSSGGSDQTSSDGFDASDLFELSTWIRVAEVVAGGGLIIGAMVIMGKNA